MFDDREDFKGFLKFAGQFCLSFLVALLFFVGVAKGIQCLEKLL